ncbi:Ktr system potassium uptake protein B (plasmid) [Roseivivax sp. THAF40]|uniref:TrkH family potassium uptake protein n=1 Tax=Roseivivax sp. THAF40 TaxID=2587858 RepID=UPI00126936D7|nr:TrkH family potassium uptake protein [Roseivivax sp. THAF40]QFT48708.1 Ktr system potassium uptake protein B [Roseivivax sp. THAF40]
MALIGFRSRLWGRIIRLTPPGLLVTLYLTVIALGALLLWLPFSTTTSISFFDALFTATSAVTVTGLSVVQTGTDFTFIGQVILLLLVQFGGLGLMTFAVFVLSAIGVKIGLGGRLILREDLNQSSMGDLLKLVKLLLAVALGCEAGGATLLALVFIPEMGFLEGAWFAIFHAVSAFNNAGFSLEGQSLVPWVGNPVINLVIPMLFILGGLGFVVLADIYETRRWRALSLHTKIMLYGTVVLMFVPWAIFAALEWTNPATLGELPIWHKIQASWFQAVTPRTAGFNTIETAGMHDATTLLTMVLMVIGGGSTSTAGGIKVTTAVVLVLATIAFFRKRTELHAFGRSLALEEVMKVLALTTVSVMILVLSLFVISITFDGPFIVLAFEVASAFGTVGLTMGATEQLDAVGRVMIMIVMFLGRVGPLTLGFFLATHSVARVRYPKGRIYLG